jgi:hypothetical protein
MNIELRSDFALREKIYILKIAFFSKFDYIIFQLTMPINEKIQ